MFFKKGVTWLKMGLVNSINKFCGPGGGTGFFLQIADCSLFKALSSPLKVPHSVYQTYCPGTFVGKSSCCLTNR